MAATLQDIVTQLKANQKSADKTGKSVEKTNTAIDKLTKSLGTSFSAFFELKKNERLNMDQLEAEREARNKNKTAFGKSFAAGQEQGAAGIPGSLDSWFTPILAALPLAIAGMRGWEVPVIKKLTRSLIASVSDMADKFRLRMANGLDDITRSILKSFGINPRTGRMLRDARGRFTGREMKSTAVMISEAFDLMHLKVTKAFGVGLDGGMIGRMVTRAGSLVSKMISPVVSIGSSIPKWISGPGARILGFADGFTGASKILSGIGTFAKKTLSVLKIVGVIFSLWDGVSAFMNTKGSLMDKLVAGVGAFVGDFFGSFFDLIKDVTSWALNLMGFENVSNWLDSFSFETIINDVINGVWTMVKGVADWVKLLFTDPGQALSDLFWGYIGAYTSIGEWLYNTAVKPLWGWFESTFPNAAGFIEEKWTAALGGAKSLGEWIWNNSIGPVWDWISNAFSGAADYLGLKATGGPLQPGEPTQETFGAVPGNYKGGSIPYGKFGVVGEKGPELVAGPVNVIPLPKKSGNNLQQEQYNLAQSQNRARSAAVLMANSGNVVNNNTQSNITYAGQGMPSPFDRRNPQPYAGHGVR